MTREEVIEKLRSIMESSAPSAIDWRVVTPETPIASLGFDSLAVLDLTYDIQQAFALDFAPEALVGVKTVGGLADFILAQSA